VCSRRQPQNDADSLKERRDGKDGDDEDLSGELPQAELQGELSDALREPMPLL
jgi:hypothetical protein